MRELETKVDRLEHQVKQLTGSVESSADLEEVAALEDQVRHFGAAVSAISARVALLARDRNYWRDFHNGFWKIFNDNAVEALARTRDQEVEEDAGQASTENQGTAASAEMHAASVAVTQPVNMTL